MSVQFYTKAKHCCKVTSHVAMVIELITFTKLYYMYEGGKIKPEKKVSSFQLKTIAGMRA